MKKSKLTKVILLFAILFYNITGVYSQCTPAFYDGFESGSYTPTWSLGAGLTSAQVNTVLPAVGKYKITATGGTSSHLTGLSTTIAATSPTTITWYIYPTGTGASNYFVIGDNAITPLNCLVFSYWDGANSTIRFVNASGTSSVVATPNTWYKIELKNVNYSTRTSDVYINGTLFLTGFAFRSTTLTNITRVHLYNFNSSTAAWDDILLGGMAVTSFPTSATCFGACNGSSSITISGGTAPFSTSWSNGSTNTNTVNGLCPGVYTVTATDGTCTINSTFTITQPAPLAATSTQTNIDCTTPSGQISYTVTGGVTPYTYSWSPNVSTTSMASGLSAGNYFFTATDLNNCVVMSSVSIISSTSAPNVTASSSNTLLCAGQSTTLTANGASTYSWNTSGTTASIIISPTVTTTYTVTGTNNSNGCSASAVITQSVINCTTGLINTGGVPVMAELYPNPTSGTFNISINENANLIIYDILGKTVLSKEIEQGNNAINLNNQPGGVYFIEIKTSNTKSTFKLIKN